MPCDNVTVELSVKTVTLVTVTKLPVVVEDSSSVQVVVNAELELLTDAVIGEFGKELVVLPDGTGLDVEFEYTIGLEDKPVGVTGVYGGGVGTE